MQVPEAFSIPSLKYDEAMELAYFGAQVLHPIRLHSGSVKALLRLY